jgi:hypothetical protein
VKVKWEVGGAEEEGREPESSSLSLSSDGVRSREICFFFNPKRIGFEFRILRSSFEKCSVSLATFQKEIEDRSTKCRKQFFV